MSQHALLNNIEHRHLRVITTRDAAYGDAVMCSALYPLEFRAAQTWYPILFHAVADSDALMAFALFGFRNDENLFLSDGKWAADYLPMTIRRAPFLIGFQQRNDGLSAEPELVLHIDLASPRLSSTEGQAIFLPKGSPSAYTEEMAATLRLLHEHRDSGRDFAAALQRLGLLEPVAITFDVPGEGQIQFSGFQAINEEALATLDKDLLYSLHQQGYLESIYFAIASLANIPKLIRLRQQRAGARSL